MLIEKVMIRREFEAKNYAGQRIKNLAPIKKDTNKKMHHEKKIYGNFKFKI